MKTQVQRITLEAAIEAITVEPATPAAAQTLHEELSGFRRELVEADDGGQQVRIEVGRSNRELVGVLNAIDDYFSSRYERPPVRIMFGGRSYRLFPSGSRRRRYLRYTDLRKPRARGRERLLEQ